MNMSEPQKIYKFAEQNNNITKNTYGRDGAYALPAVEFLLLLQNACRSANEASG